LLIGLAALLTAVWAIRRELQQVPLSEVQGALAAIPPAAIAAAAVFTLLSFACLAVVEWYALRFRGSPRPFRNMVVRSAGANSLSSLIGFGLASGTAVRLKFYESAKLSAKDVAGLVVLYLAAIYFSGLVALGCSALLAIGPIAAALSLPTPLIAAASLILVTPAALWFTSYRRRRTAPSRRGRALALAAGLGDWVFSGAALFVLTSDTASNFPAFMAIFCLGALVGSAVGVPGAIGVLEATLLTLRAKALMHQTAAALIAYRLIYFVAPALLTLACLGVRQLLRVRRLWN
jgi:phosphatidylglycerol lysyltransferase